MNTPQTRRLTILNTDEIEAIFGLPQFTEDERQVHFALSPIESEVVNAARTITAAVHLTLQIGYFKAKSQFYVCLLYTSPSPRDGLLSRMPSSA